MNVTGLTLLDPSCSETSWQWWSCMQGCFWKTNRWRLSRFFCKQYKPPLCVGELDTLSVTQTVPSDCNWKQTVKREKIHTLNTSSVDNYSISLICISSLHVSAFVCLFYSLSLPSVSLSSSLVKFFSLHFTLRWSSWDTQSWGGVAGRHRFHF